MSAPSEGSDLAPAQRRTLSKTFLILAWTIEIAAAGVGLTLALARLRDDVGMQGILAALPFFAVAIMELTKIPLATVIYHTVAKRWRYGFTFALALSMLITFETFVIGFDTYQARLEKQIKPTVDAVKELKLQISSIEENIAASDSLSKETTQIDKDYKAISITINSKYEKITEDYEKQKLSIDRKYDGNEKAVQGLIINIDGQIAELNKEITDEQNNLREGLENLRNQSIRREESNRTTMREEIEQLELEKTRVRKDTLTEKQQIRDKAQAEYEACQKADAASFFGKNCEALKTQEVSEIERLEEKERLSIKKIEGNIQNLQQLLSGNTAGEAVQQENAIRKKYEDRISAIRSKIGDLQLDKANKITELGKLRGNRSRSDIAQMTRLEAKVQEASVQRNKELDEARKAAKQRRDQANDAKTDVVTYTKQANQLRKALAPECAKLNDVVSNNQVYRLAIQFHDVDDACDLTQGQLTLTQWIWYGSLALVTSALGTTLAFAGLVIKYPPSFPKGGRFGGLFAGVIRRLNYALALLHRRLRKPKIKEVPVEKEIIKEVTREVPVDRVVEKTVEVTKEVPVEKVVYRDVPREVVKRELVHVPLFTQDVKAVIKGD